MQNTSFLSSFFSKQLTHQDIIEFEAVIRDEVRCFLPFSSYSLSLLAQDAKQENTLLPRYDFENKELLLPLVFQNKALALFVARGVKLTAPKTAPRYIAQLTHAVLERIALYKSSISDQLSSLFNEKYFMEHLQGDIALVQSCLLPGGTFTEHALPSRLGLIILNIDKLQWYNEHYAYELGDEIVHEVGRAIRTVCPQHALTARLDKDTFAILLPDAGVSICSKLAKKLRAHIARLRFTDKLTESKICITASLGHVCYPQHMSGVQLKQAATEQARIFLYKGIKSVLAAQANGHDNVFGYKEILAKGGLVLEILPMNTVALNLGSSVGAEVGQRFLVYPSQHALHERKILSENEQNFVYAPPVYKGEVLITHVQQDMAFAELLHLGDPAWPLTAGDQLELVSENESFFEAGMHSKGGSENMLDSLDTYEDFLVKFSAQRNTVDAFCLVIIRILESPKERPSNFQQYMESRSKKIVDLLAQRLEDIKFLGGSFGLGGLIYYLPEKNGEETAKRMHEIVRFASTKLATGLAIGIAQYPYLNFSPEDMLDNARKAFEHAILLEPPLLAVFDSISLNVAADRLYADGLIHAAIEEFKLSLLADKSNGVARNSLGICYAQINQLEQAKYQFEQVIVYDPEDFMAYFNLGWVSQLMGDFVAAQNSYEHCLEIDSEHVFALVHLAQLYEKTADIEQAESLLHKAAKLPHGEPLAMRHLARLYVEQGNFEQARESLHQALAINHNDAYCLHLLSRLYLEQGEDPQIAEILARQAAALSPNRDEYWDTLVHALQVQEKFEEANKAAARKMTA